MKWIDAGDIKYWFTAKRRHCEATLPELIRRLISATAPTITRLDFPSGDSVTTGGWDGHLETLEISPFFPAGVSGWELSAEQSPEKKADRDFDGRTLDSLGLSRSESTFVVVTPRPFPGRRAWEARKAKLKEWKAVRVIAASELEQWLDAAPAVALWLARQIGKAPDHVRDIEAVWEEWSLATDPALTPDLVTAGREPEVLRVHGWLQAPPSRIEVQGDTPDEALGFLYAAIDRLDEADRIRAVSRCVVVEDLHQLRACTAFQQPLIIAAPSHCRAAVGAAIKKGHHVFLLAEATTFDRNDDVLVLPRSDTTALVRALRSNGFSEGDAYRLVRDSGASIPVLRRILPSTVPPPEWTEPDRARLLLPALLAGAWHEQKKGDRDVLEAVSGRPYAEYAASLHPLLLSHDSPLRRVDDVWMLKSPLDAWFLIAHYLDVQDLTRFRQVATSVFGEVDPKYDLPPAERFAAAVYGKVSGFSSWLQQGLAKSLVLLGVFGERAGVGLDHEWAASTTRSVLREATSWQHWSSLSQVTPLLAESAPEPFVVEVEEVLSKRPDIFVELLSDDGTTFGECRHCGLLWALEALAWAPEYFQRAVSVLARLAAIDPGGNWSNRPATSLRDVFLPNPPQTYAPAEARLIAFDSIRDHDPKLAWQVVEGLIGGGMVSPGHQFRWRVSPGRRDPLESTTEQDYSAYVKGLSSRLGALISATPDNLTNAVRAFVSAPVVRDSVVATLASTVPSSLTQEQRSQLWARLRDALHWINSHGDEGDKKHRDALSNELARFAPLSALEANEWLLGSDWPDLPEGEPDDYQEREELIAKRRRESARSVLDRCSIREIVEFASRVTSTGVFGHAFGSVVDPLEDDAFLVEMLRQDVLNVRFVIGYSIARVEVKGRSWVTEQARRLKAQAGYSARAIAALYLAAPEGRSTWEEVASHGSDVDLAYWQLARGRSRENSDDVDIAIEKLIAAGRPDSALAVAATPKVTVRSESLIRVLRGLREFDPKGRDVDGTMFGFYLGELFNRLYESADIPLDELAALEWPFARLLADDLRRPTKQPLAIHRLLQRDPSFFATLVTFIYKPHDRMEATPEGGVTEEQKALRADNTRQVFRSWRLLPGTELDGSVDEAALFDWVSRVRKHAIETGHVTGADLQIAEILARSPVGSDGLWPHESVRSVVEQLQSRVVDEHFRIAVMNNRGVTTRGLGDGGRQERDLAEKYAQMSRAVAVRWPRMGAILKGISVSYERQARHEDASKDLRELDW